MAHDDGFGPPLRGGGRSAGAAPVRERRHPDQAGFGPPQRGRRRLLPRLGPRLPRPGVGSLGRALRTAVVAALVLAVVAGATGVALLVYTSLRMQRADVRGLERASGQMNVLVVGSDSREGLTAEELQAMGTEAVAGRRTDTLFLLSVSGGRAAMLSFPRDLFVTTCDGGQARINVAYAQGGPSCLVQTVAQESGIPVTHYLEVNFLGFKQIVDAVGGVGIYLEQPLVDVFAGIDLPAGCQQLDGGQALGFVRARHADSDLGRIARQQRFLRELAKEVTAPSTLLNVPRLFATAGAAGGAVTADHGLGVVDLLKLIRAARGLAGAGLATYTVPARAATVGGASVLRPVQGEAEALFAQFRTGSILQVAGGDPAGLQPGDVRVEVRNGAGIAGLAAQAKVYLQERGFVVTGIGNAEPVERTVVRHAPRLAPAARLVAEHVPGATTEAVGDGTAVALVLAADANLSDAPTPAAPAQPSGAPPDAPTAVGAGPVPEDC